MKKSHLIVFLISSLISFNILAAPVFEYNSNGKLFSITNVAYENSVFNIDFVDGTCIEVFEGCDSEDDFPFPGVSGYQASDFLLNELLTDRNGLFDQSPYLINGCTDPNLCVIYTPIKLYNDGRILRASADNFSDESLDKVSGRISNRTHDKTILVNATWAKWSETAVSVDEPSALILLLISFGLFLRRKR